MSQLGNSDLDALNAALDGLNSLQVALGLVSKYLAGLQRAMSYCELTFARDGSLEAHYLPTRLEAEGSPVSQDQMDDIRFHCKWLAVHIDELWASHAKADTALLGLPAILIERLNALTGSPWIASVRRNCLDLVLKWPGEIHHQTSLAATKVFGRADELLENAEDNPPFEEWAKFERLLASYRHDLFAVRDAVQKTPTGTDSVLSMPVSANTEKLFPGGMLKDRDIVELVIKLNTEKGNGKSINAIAREYTGELKGTDAKAKSMLAQIRRLVREGRVKY